MLVSQSRGFISYSVEDGLAQSNVIDISEDHLGNLWLATTGGLSKFNGLDFVTFKKQDGLLSNQIFCMSIDPSGNLWLGTKLGISRYDGHQFRNYYVSSLGNEHYINNILADQQGSIWFTSTSGSLFSLGMENGLSGEINLEKNFDEIITGLQEADTGMLVATKSQGIFIIEDQEFRTIPTGNKLQNLLITCIYVDQNRITWLGTNAGIYRFNSNGLELIHSFHMDPKDFKVNTISVEDGGTVWIGTNKGAYTYFQGTCSPVGAADGLTDNAIYKIHQDREGTLWFGSFGKGFFKSLGELFTRIDKRHGLDYDYISSISPGKHQDYWFGSYGGGVYHYQPAQGPGSTYQIQNLDHNNGLSNDLVYHVTMDDQDRLWIATAQGLNSYKDGRLTYFYEKDGLPSDRVFSVLQSTDGNIYCGTDMGISKMDQGTFQFTNYQYQGDNHHNRVRTLVEMRDGRLLLGTHGGLKVFDGTSIRDYFEIDSLRHYPVSTVYEDEQGGIWCALRDDGIVHFNPDLETVNHLTEEDGLSSNIIYSLTKDNFGAVWAGTPQGLDKLSLSPSGALDQIRHYGTNEGFFGIETNTNAVYKEPGGEIWFGTVEGVYKCRPEMDMPNPLEPITYITGIRLFSQNVDWSEMVDSTAGWFGLPVNLSLAPNQNHLTFDFFGNSLRNQAQVSYQYILENFDRNWQPATNNNLAVYTNLPPGKYSFKVKASNKDGVWNQQAATFDFEITPPFWSTWWFYTLVVVILAIAGRLYYNLRLQQKLKSLIQIENLKNAELVEVRKRVAEDFHDQVGNQLASITVLVQLIQAKISSEIKK